jgi:hypothetical protein
MRTTNCETDRRRLLREANDAHRIDAGVIINSGR